MLDKTQIKRVLKDHCHHLIKYNIDDEHWTDCIAQTLIEHEREVENCICMDCGEIIKVRNQSKHIEDCKRQDLAKVRTGGKYGQCK